jgi:acetyl-CoA carboxylase biotin carboxyl carrier protein
VSARERRASSGRETAKDPPKAREESTAAGGTDTTALLELIDRLESLLEGSGMTEIEVEAGGTALLLRLPDGPTVPMSAAAVPGAAARPVEPTAAEGNAAQHAVLAPLTGIFYTAPTPEATPYVQVGSDIHAGQVIGLIEAMKLFNEIKSDRAGRVVRIAAESGTLVKAKQPLIELEPA